MSDEAEIMLTAKEFGERAMLARRFGEQRAYLKCAEIAKKEAVRYEDAAMRARREGRDRDRNVALSASHVLSTLASRFRQMAEGGE